MNDPSPGYVELVKAIENEIRVNGEIVCFQRFVKQNCSLSERYAYYLLEAVAPIWGYKVERIPYRGSVFLLRITKL